MFNIHESPRNSHWNTCQKTHSVTALDLTWKYAVLALPIYVESQEAESGKKSALYIPKTDFTVEGIETVMFIEVLIVEWYQANNVIINC